MESKSILVIICLIYKIINGLQLASNNQNNAQLYYVPATGQYIWASRQDTPSYLINFLTNTTTTSRIDTVEQQFDCGIRNVDDQLYRRRQAKIIGGSEPIYGAFPWQVEIALFDKDTHRWRHHCGGALLPSASGEFVLTAAHCLQPPVEIQQMRLIAGDHNLNKYDSHEQMMGVIDFIVHPSFRRDGPYSNDIAIIRVRTRFGSKIGFKFTSHVQPICLPAQSDSPAPGTWCDVSGWGVQQSDDMESLSPTLQAITVPIVKTSQCRSTSFYGGRQQSILDSMLCAGVMSGGQDACGGDSGGPLACEHNGRYHLFGLVSWGDGCGKQNRPGVYTRVDYYVNWILASMRQLNERNQL